MFMVFRLAMSGTISSAPAAAIRTKGDFAGRAGARDKDRAGFVAGVTADPAKCWRASTGALVTKAMMDVRVGRSVSDGGAVQLGTGMGLGCWVRQAEIVC